MINKISIFFTFLIIILPISLISGPAIPDLTITFSSIFFLFLIYYKKNFELLLENNLLILSIFFWGYLLLISIIAENKYLSFRDAIIFIRILFIPILFFYLFSIDKKYLEKIIFVIFFTTIFVTIDTFYQYTQYDPELGFGRDLFGFVSNWYGRLTGPFGDELIPGAYLSKFTFLGLIFLFIKIQNKNYLNLISIIYLISIGLTIFATGERMAMATFLMGLVFLFIFFKNKRIIFLLSLILIIFFSYISIKIHPFYNDYKIIESTPYHLGLKIEKQFKCKNNKSIVCNKTIVLQPEFSQVIKNFKISAYGEIYNLGIKMLQDHKFFGTGLNNFTYLCKNDERYINIMKNYTCVSHPHNLYIQWLVETGIIGFLIFLIYLTFIIYLIIKKYKNEYSIIGLATLLILFWPIMSTGSLLKNWNGISSFYIIGICLALYQLNKKTD